jgi:hypothetical protein
MNPTSTDTAQSVRCLAHDICGDSSQIVHRPGADHLHRVLRRRLRPRKSPRWSDGARLGTSALHDATMEESTGAARRKQCTDGLRSSRLPEDRDIVRVAAKPSDVLRDPFENREEIPHSKIRASVGMCEKPKIPKR